MVLSPSSALLKLFRLVADCCTASASRSAVTASVLPSALPTPSISMPHKIPLVPPALSLKAAPAAASTVCTPPSVWAAASAAALAPRDMPIPWSPSPATASSLPR